MSSELCQATTLQDAPCKIFSIKDSKFCRVHQKYTKKEVVPDPKDLQIIALQEQVKNLTSKVSKNEYNDLSIEDFFWTKSLINFQTRFPRPKETTFKLNNFNPDSLKAGWSFVDPSLNFPINVHTSTIRVFDAPSIDNMCYISLSGRHERLPITKIVIYHLKIGNSPLEISFSGKRYQILVMDLRISGVHNLISFYGDISIVDFRSKEYYDFLADTLLCMTTKLGTSNDNYLKTKLEDLSSYRNGIYHVLRNLHTNFYLHHQMMSIARYPQDREKVLVPHLILAEV